MLSSANEEEIQSTLMSKGIAVERAKAFEFFNTIQKINSCNELHDAKTADEIIVCCRTHNIPIDENAVRKCLLQNEEEKELSEKDLDNVAGGILLCLAGAAVVTGASLLCCLGIELGMKWYNVGKKH